MRSPAFPPRRPSHIIRYLFPVVLLICIIYYLSSDSVHSSPVPDVPLSPDHGAPVLDHANAADQAMIEHAPSPEKPLEEPKIQDVVDTKEEEEHGSVEKPVDESSETKGGASDTHSDSESVDKVKGAEKDHDESGQTKGGSGKNDDDSTPVKPPEHSSSDTTGDHPIDELIRIAEKSFKEVLAKESTTLAEAAKAYRERRGRHPPPGFDKWFKFAQENNAIIVEDFFDRIYHDLNPFWGLDPKVIRKEAWDFEMTISIRNHNATAESDWFWTQIWLEMFKTIEHLLPDMDVALNAMDEPRLVVPWEEVATYVQKGERTRKLTPVDEVVSTFQDLPPAGEGSKKPATRKKNWEETSKMRSSLAHGVWQRKTLTLNRSFLVDCTPRLSTRQSSSSAECSRLLRPCAQLLPRVGHASSIPRLCFELLPFDRVLSPAGLASSRGHFHASAIHSFY